MASPALATETQLSMTFYTKRQFTAIVVTGCDKSIGYSKRLLIAITWTLSQQMDMIDLLEELYRIYWKTIPIVVNWTSSQQMDVIDLLEDLYRIYWKTIPIVVNWTSSQQMDMINLLEESYRIYWKTIPIVVNWTSSQQMDVINLLEEYCSNSDISRNGCVESIEDII